MTSQTVSAGNIYRLTLTVDEAFLTDPETVYPVSIDPELSISDNTHGAGAIEDVNIYEGTPNANADWKYMHVGYYDDTYGVGRILVRLTGLINDEDYQSVEADEILTAYFYLKEATGKAAANIKLYPHRGNSNWTESTVTWNTAGHTVGDIVTTVNHARSDWGCYDIKSLLVDWKNGTNNANSGFVLRHSDEENATKGFYSSEYSTTDYRPYVVVTYTASVSQPIGNGTYYINNLSTGKYIKYATSTPVGASGLIADIGNSIRWQIAWTGEAYTIRLASSPTKYLAVPTSTSSSSVETVTVSDGATVPERCLWTITPGAYGNFRLQSVYNSRYLASNNSALYTSTTTPQASYNTYIWRFANVASYRELQSNFTVSDIILNIGESKSIDINLYPEYAMWSNLGDFTINYNSGTSGCATYSATAMTGSKVGIAQYKATHKVTGIATVFNIFIDRYTYELVNEFGFVGSDAILIRQVYDRVAEQYPSESFVEQAWMCSRLFSYFKYSTSIWNAVAGSIDEAEDDLQAFFVDTLGYSESEFLQMRSAIDANYSDASTSDFAHFSYAMASRFAYQLDKDLEGSLGVDLTGEDLSFCGGWLGDAAIILNTPTTVLKNDDYHADLDAENIYRLVLHRQSIPDAANEYFAAISESNTRATVFLGYIDYDTVEEKVLSLLGDDMEVIKEEYSDTYNFLRSLEDELSDIGDYAG